MHVRVGANFTRPANTTAYTSGDLMANSETAGSVVPMSFDMSKLRGAQGALLHSVRIRKTTNTATAASFRLHLFRRSPTVANGDNGAFQVSNGVIGGVAGGPWVTSIDLDMSSNGLDLTGGTLVLLNSARAIEHVIDMEGIGTIYGLMEARGAYAPGSAEQFLFCLGLIV